VEEPDRGEITVECGGAFPGLPRLERSGRGEFRGDELDVADKLCLTLFARSQPHRPADDPAGRVRVEEVIFPIPWTEIVHIHFSVRRVVRPEPKSGTGG
jgi:hypothetical protein